MTLIRKSPAEEIPAIFDFRSRLGELVGAQIMSVDSLTVTPSGDLSAGLPGEAIIDQVSCLEVAVRLTGGTSRKEYKVVCQATVRHSGTDYIMEVPMSIYVGAS